MLRTVVVVGASLAGLRAIETLRSEGFDGRIDWVGEETHLPYDRPPLSKELLRGEWCEDRLALRRGYDDLKLEMHLGQRARALDVASRQVELEDGTRLAFDGLIIATGARARRLAATESLASVYRLRTLEDARAIRAALDARPRVAIIGAGFIGCEVAAACRHLGLPVLVVESAPAPCMRGLGRQIGERIAALHREEGVDLRCAVDVRALEGARRVERVRLTDGSVEPADLVVVGIGAEPATDWLVGSGLELDDGVVCDATCSTRVPGIVAAGDVARAYHPLYGRHLRMEHWTHAVEQGVTAARTLLHKESAQPLVSVPLVWSDQYDVRIQLAGCTQPDDALHLVDGSLDSRRFAAAYVRDGRVVGAVTFNDPRRLIQLRQRIARGARVEELLD